MRYVELVKDANQNIFQFLIKRKTPAEIQKICRKIVWFAPPASLAGGAAGRDSIIPLKKGSCFVQQLQPNATVENQTYLPIAIYRTEGLI